MLNDELEPNLLCTLANFLESTPGRGAEFRSYVQTVLTIGQPQLEKGVVAEIKTHVRKYIGSSKNLTFYDLC